MKENEENPIDKLEKLMEEKAFSQLSVAEKEWVLRFVESDEEYDSIRSVDLLLNSIGTETLTPDPTIISRLKTRGNRRSWIHSIFAAKVPAWAFAAFLIGVFGAWYVLPHQPVQPQIVERITVKTDTLIVVRPDTVIVRKVIYRERPANPFVQVRSGIEQTPLPEGSTMKEKEELQTLLVSGTER